MFDILFRNFTFIVIFHKSCFVFRLYHLTFFSFFLAFGHFVTELYPYETAELSLGVLAPLTVSSKFSI